MRLEVKSPDAVFFDTLLKFSRVEGRVVFCGGSGVGGFGSRIGVDMWGSEVLKV